MRLILDSIFVKKTPVDSRPTRVYVVLKDAEGKDYYGFVKLKIFDEQQNLVLETQPEVISVFANDYDGVFFDMTLKPGKYTFEAIVYDKNKVQAQIETPKPIEPLTVYLDSDRDGIANIEDPDDDNDGLPDTQEQTLGTDPLDPDSDDDGVLDGQDLAPLDPTTTIDTDSDGISDPQDPDDDNDGLPDVQEQTLGTDPKSTDSDQDGLTDAQEVQLGTDPLNKDTDNDGVPDGQDAFPLDPQYIQDTNHNGIPDSLEQDPKLLTQDTDRDGLSDLQEQFVYKTSSTVADTDGDGLTDYQEVQVGSDPLTFTSLDADQDKDGLTIKQELALGTKDTTPVTRSVVGIGLNDLLIWKAYTIGKLGSIILLLVLGILLFGRIKKRLR